MRFEPEESRGHTFRPMLTAVEPGRELRWAGRPRFPGGFGVGHYWIIGEMPGGKGGLRDGGFGLGLGAPFVGEGWLGGFNRGFASMNRAHKRRAEEAAG